jgi:hypothetical protein
MTRLFLTVTALWSAGCSPGLECEEGYAYGLDSDCSEYDRTDDTSQSQHTGDSGDSGDSGDTGETTGEFLGTIEMAAIFLEEDGGDQCEGVLTATYADVEGSEGTRNIHGTFNCSWLTAMGQTVDELVGEGILDGGFAEGSGSGGLIYGPIQDIWEGTVDDLGILTGSWEGDHEAIEAYSIPAMNFSGNFSIATW